MNIVEISNLTFKYGHRDAEQTKPVLCDISFSIGEDESVGVIGANGVGKSTLLKLMVGLLPGYGGRVNICGKDVVKDNLAFIRKNAGYIFQDSDSQLFMNTVYDDVAFGPKNYGLNDEDVSKKVDTALKLTHIENLKDRHIYRLSGGQKKLAAIAAILSMEPKMLLMDEPSVALDPVNRDNLIEVLNTLPGMKLIASHDLDFIYDTCKRTIVLADGKITYDGATKKILTDRKSLEMYGLRLPLSFRFMENK